MQRKDKNFPNLLLFMSILDSEVGGVVVELLKERKTINWLLVESLGNVYVGKQSNPRLIGQPELSLYLGKLEAIGVCTEQRFGKEVWYTLNEKYYNELLRDLEILEDSIITKQSKKLRS